MEPEELFDHALTSLPEAVGDLLRNRRDPSEFVFASFDGASELGMALIAADVAGGVGVDGHSVRSEVEQMIQAASIRGEELVVSLMVTRDVLSRILTASGVCATVRVAVELWLETPVRAGHFRVVAIAGEQVRAATVDAVSEGEAPVSSSSLN